MPTRTGTNISIFWATFISRPPATGSCFVRWQNICFRAQTDQLATPRNRTCCGHAKADAHGPAPDARRTTFFALPLLITRGVFPCPLSDPPRRTRKLLYQKIQEHTYLWQAVFTREIDCGESDRLGVMKIRQNRDKRSSADWLADKQLGQTHDTGTAERQSQRDVAVIARQARNYLNLLDALRGAEGPTDGICRNEGYAGMACEVWRHMRRAVLLEIFR